MKQKNIINDTFEKHKKLVLEHLHQTTAKKPLKENIDYVEFSTTADIDMKKMGKPHGFEGVQVDSEVNVFANGEYEEVTSGDRGEYVLGAVDIEVRAAEDIYGYDADGNKSDDLVFKKGELIDTKFITADSMQKIEKLADKNVKERAAEGDFDDDDVLQRRQWLR